MPSDETWLPIPGYPAYEISDHGRIRSLARQVRNRWGTMKPVPERILAQPLGGGVAGHRYRVCTLYRDGQPKQRTVHTLVLETFVGPRPEKGAHGCHRDDNTDNNHLDNLYWGTPAQNSRDAVNNGRCWKTKITHCPRGHEYTEENTYITPSSGHRTCRACIIERGEAKKTRPHSRDRTHCPQGHQYDEANTTHSAGRRVCRTCSRDRAREYSRRKKAEKLAAGLRGQS